MRVIAQRNSIPFRSGTPVTSLDGVIFIKEDDKMNGGEVEDTGSDEDDDDDDDDGGAEMLTLAIR